MNRTSSVLYWPRASSMAAVTLVLAALGCVTNKKNETPPAPVQDPRVGLRAGWHDAGVAAWNIDLVANRTRPDGWFNAAKPGDFAFANTDISFSGNFLFQGSYNGVQVWDISDPVNPRLRSAIACPGGQGDVSVYRDLLFMSAEETRGRLDCGSQGIADSVSADRLRGVRIFDIRDIDRPRPITTVQTCRGSHTHTLVSDPTDTANVYVYVSGTGGVRSAKELAGCSGAAPTEDPNTSLFRIEVIRVPLAAPQNARIVSSPRIFADRSGKNIASLQRADTTDSLHRTSETSRCHDITVYSAIGLAAGACSGNGILLDIRNPANPTRVAEVSDPNFAYWHSATFNNDGTRILFTDEWGGGTRARCRATDRPEWGANAFYTLENNRMTPAGMFKLPAAQTEAENCVAHNGSLVPVPGRDIMVQAWYQGGLSVLDFTDPAKPFEIAWFDRGPLGDTIMLGGLWSTYWYNGRIYGSEIARGLDVFELKPSAHLSQNEIDAAKLVRVDRFNAQDQQKITWPASYVVARAYVDQLRRGGGLSPTRAMAIHQQLYRIEKEAADQQRTDLSALAMQIHADVSGSRQPAKVRALADVIFDLSGKPRVRF